MLALAFRNVLRNRRRSLLTALAIGFTVTLLVFAGAMSTGSYATMAENATRLLSGHIQVQAPGYLDDPSPRRVVADAAALQAWLREQPGVLDARARIEAFALVAVGERSFGAFVLGVDAAAESAHSTVPAMLARGRYLGTRDAAEAVIGSTLARNLGADLGAELVIVGTGREGSVAALALNVVGIIDSGIVELDRSLVQVPIDAMAEAFEFGAAVSVLVLDAENAVAASPLARKLQEQLQLQRQPPPASGVEVLSWQHLQPELVQTIEFDRASNTIFFVLLGVMVVFSIANTFVMTVFERTREFGMLLAVGMRPGQLQWLLQLEALLLCGAGVVGGTLLGGLLVGVLIEVGIPMPAAAEDMMRRFHMPDRIYPAWSAGAMLVPPLLMLLTTQLAALLPTWRIRRLQPVEALRA